MYLGYTGASPVEEHGPTHSPGPGQQRDEGEGLGLQLPAPRALLARRSLPHQSQPCLELDWSH